MTQRDLIEDLVPTQKQQEAEPKVLMPSVGIETVAMGLTPMEALPSDPTGGGGGGGGTGGTGTIVQRLATVKGIRSARLARAGEYNPAKWKGQRPVLVTGRAPVSREAEFGPTGVLIAIALGYVIHVMWSLFSAQFLTRLNFGNRLSDDDLITQQVRDGTPGYFTLTLRSVAPVTWWKAIEVRNASNVVTHRIYNQESRNKDTLMVSNDALQSSMLVFWKAKFLGIHALKYQLAGLQELENKHLTLTWEKDAAWHWPK